MSNWSAKLKDPRWQKLRLKVMERDGWKCVICDSNDKVLHVHHIVYDRRNPNPWEYDAETLQTLCRECHKVRQELIDNAANALKLALKNVPTDRVKLIAQVIFEEAMRDMR